MLQSGTSSISSRAGLAKQAVAGRDYMWLAMLLGGLLILTGLPYLYGSGLSGERHFMGIVMDVPDTAQYFAWMRAHQQSLVVANWMTPEPNSPAFFNLLWWTLAQLSLWTGAQFALVFQALRVVAGATFGWVLFWIYGLLAQDRRERWFASLLVLSGAGIGWVWVVEKYVSRRADLLYPLDVQVAEPNAFLEMIGYPHFLLAAALILAVFGLFFVGSRGGHARAYAWAALLALVLGLQHAYDLLTVYGVLGGYVLLMWWQQKRFPRHQSAGLVLIGLVSSPPAVYFTYLTTRDPIWRQVLAQFANAGVYTPNPLHLLIVFGPQLVLAVLALPGLLRRRSDADLFLLAWVVVGFGLLYIPTDFQIHMLNPYQVPLALLAMRLLWRKSLVENQQREGAPTGALAPEPRRRAWHANPWPVALLLLAVLTNAYLLTWRFVDLGRRQSPYFLQRDEVVAIEWLNRQPGDRVVLSSEALGQYVPALAGKRAVLAHWAQTVDYFGKRAAVARFFDPATPASERAAILRRYQVAYVLVGDPELRAGAANSLGPASFEPVLTLPAAVVYRVR